MMPLRLRQLLAVAILVALVFLLLGVVVGPLLGQFRSGQEQIDDLEQRLAVYQRLIAELPAQEERLAELKRENPLSRLLLAESRPALAGAELQQLVGRLVGETGAQLVSTQIVTTSDGGAPVPSVGLKVHMRGETDQMVRLLYALAWHEPLLLVENVVVLSNPRVDMQRFRRAEDLKAVPSLDVTFDLKGFIAAGGTP
ncbi:type II secretion system protein GspM [Pseudomonas oryzae]|uniref:Type II secretion system (T2SS), protein M subtype b n=1 Tax=Pseudomonas oryzae TaxID=1392877 RepID=A0A1H1RVE9_9PSED|nr:type II secretion system protein GspM [Pseudomonas oryzae]SDS39672.1 Type II secretion system (T2SS), protein M subtype b [Pseudomonas oryzae]